MPQRTIAFVGLPRYTVASVAAGVAFDTDNPAQNLADWEAWSVTRIPSKDPRLTYIEGIPTMPLDYYGPTPRVGSVGVPNHSLTLGGTARSVLYSAGATGYAPIRIAPDGVSALLNLTGAATDIQEDPYGASDGNALLGQPGPVNSGVIVDFPTPARSPRTGADRQLYRVRLTWTTKPSQLSFAIADGAGPSTQIQFGIPGSDPVPASGSVILLPWDAALLTLNPDGSGARLQITAFDVDDDFRIEAVDWLSEQTLSAGSVLGETDWADASADQFDEDWGDTVSGSAGIAPMQTLAHIFETNIGSVGKVVTYFRDPLNVPGYIDVGEYLVGPKFQPLRDRDWGEMVSMIGRSSVTEMERGSEAIVRREPRRKMKITLPWLTIAEGEMMFERLWRAADSQPFIIAVTPRRPSRKHMTLYVRCTSLPELSRVAYHEDMTSITFEATEKM